MKSMDFYADEWREFLENCDFTDVELQIIHLKRTTELRNIDIGQELGYSEKTIIRRCQKIQKKIIHYITTK